MEIYIAPITVHLVIVGLTNACGSSSTTLCYPRGIFVTRTLELYVADGDNNRIQRFRFDEKNGTTVISNTSHAHIQLNTPTSVVLDNDGYIFFIDQKNNRIIGQHWNGFRCIVGCSTISGYPSNQLHNPRRLAFDSLGNLYVTDEENHRIQQFMLDNRGCCE
jgi:6-phosphogluconolactonase (cycloisomerase 2 family)